MKHKPLTGEGGKGSSCRVSDWRKFQDNFDRIFGDKSKSKVDKDRDGDKRR